MTRLEALEKVAEAARKCVPPEAYYPKNKGTAVYSLAKALEELDQTHKTDLCEFCGEQKTMKWPDMRIWIERKIAYCAFWFSVIGLAVTTFVGGFFSYTAYKLNEKTFCFNHIGPKLEAVKSQIYDLPKLISGCAIDPTTYCGSARSVLSKTQNLVLEINSSVVEKVPAIDNLSRVMSRADQHLKNTNNRNRDALINDAREINLLRHPVSSLNTKNIECTPVLY